MSDNPNIYHYKPLMNEPLLVLFIFTSEEVVPVMIGLMLGIMMKNTIPFLLVSVLYIYISQKIKLRFEKGYVRHKAWSKGFIPVNTTKALPDPIIKNYHR